MSTTTLRMARNEWPKAQRSSSWLTLSGNSFPSVSSTKFCGILAFDAGRVPYGVLAEGARRLIAIVEKTGVDSSFHLTYIVTVAMVCGGDVQ